MENYHISQNLTLSVMHILERYFVTFWSRCMHANMPCHSKNKN